jgi:hypothetical protein
VPNCSSIYRRTRVCRVVVVEMNASKMPPILLGILLACLAFSANCTGAVQTYTCIYILSLSIFLPLIIGNPSGAGERGDEESPAAAGHRRWQPNGGTTMIGRSSSTMDVVAPRCEKLVCAGPSTCYCCPTLRDKPCFLEPHACLLACKGRRLPAPLPPEVPSSARGSGPSRFL